MDSIRVNKTIASERVVRDSSWCRTPRLFPMELTFCIDNCKYSLYRHAATWYISTPQVKPTEFILIALYKLYLLYSGGSANEVKDSEEESIPLPHTGTLITQPTKSPESFVECTQATTKSLLISQDLTLIFQGLSASPSKLCMPYSDSVERV